MMRKKGQGLSLNMIIIAIIALIVLVVVVTIFVRKTSNIAEATSCESRGGKCIPQGGDCESIAGKEYPVRSFTTCDAISGPGICCFREFK